MKRKKLFVILFSVLFGISLVGCSGSQSDSTAASTSATTNSASSEKPTTDSSSTDTNATENVSVENSTINTADLFSDRDLEQSADLTNAKSIKLVSGQDVSIKEEGVYVISGNVEDVTIVVEAAEDAKVQLVLDGASIKNENAPAVYVKEADKVFVTSTDSENHMEVTGSFTADGDTKLDAVIFSKSDLVLNGTGSLEIDSAKGNGITSKDDLKITGGSYTITSAADSIEANDSILINDGTFNINSSKDALHSENEEDTTVGYIYIKNGTFTITAAEDAIQGTSIVQIDGGTITIKTCAEGIEGTSVKINDGKIDIYATDDGINAANKSTSYDVAIEINGGTISIKMGSGDTDAVDANGDIYVNGGTINIEATSAFDPDGAAELNGGDVTVNGEVITEITVTQRGGGKMMRRQ